MKSLGGSHTTASIAPPEENLKNIKNLNEMGKKMEKWDNDRRIASIKIVKELLDMAKESQHSIFHKTFLYFKKMYN